MTFCFGRFHLILFYLINVFIQLETMGKIKSFDLRLLRFGGGERDFCFVTHF